EVVSNVIDRFWFKRKLAFASDAETPNNTHVLQNAKVLGHRLPRQIGARRQTRDRLRSAISQSGKHRQARLISQRSEHRCTNLECCRPAMTLVRHAGQCFRVECSSRPHSYETPRRGGCLAACRSRTRRCATASPLLFSPR